MPTTDDQRDPAAAAGPVTDPDATVPDQDAAAPDSGRPPAGRRTKSWRQLMMVVVAAIVLMLLIKAFVVQVYRIPSSSMENTLLTGDRVLVNDNRAISDDSRGHKSAGFPAMGTIPENKVCGRAFMIIWPPWQIGDLPIPATFQQAALAAGAAAAAG